MRDLSEVLSTEARRAWNAPEPGRWIPRRVGIEDINLASGYPYPEAIPLTFINQAFGAMIEGEGNRAFQYTGSGGQEWWSQWLQKEMTALTTSHDRIIATFGALQAIDLVARALIDENTSIIVQESTYMEALEVFQVYTSHIVVVSRGDERFDVDQVASLMQQQAEAGLPVRLIYWGADFQNPTGIEMAVDDRMKLLDAAYRGGAYIVEDAAYRALAFGTTLPSLKELDTHHCVVYVGTLSKTLAPALRMGWALGPESLVAIMERLKKDLGNPLLESLVGYYLARNDYREHVQRLREHYSTRAAFMVARLQQCMPDGVYWDIPRGGYFVWLRFNPTWPSDQVQEACRNNHVVVLSGRHFGLVDGGDPHAIRLSFSYESMERIATAVDRLGVLLRRFPGHS